MSAICIATRGMVCPPYQQDQFISCDAPVMQQALEVRPKVRSVSGSITPTAVAPPVVISTQEVRPSAKLEQGPAPSNPDPKPAQTAALELRPIIKKVEE
jgi:hypothetical protein